MPPVKPLIIRIVTGASTLPPANAGGARRTWLAIRDHRLDFPGHLVYLGHAVDRPQNSPVPVIR
jgi:hypothetical protein